VRTLADTERLFGWNMPCGSSFAATNSRCDECSEESNNFDDSGKIHGVHLFFVKKKEMVVMMKAK